MALSIASKHKFLTPGTSLTRTTPQWCWPAAVCKVPVALAEHGGRRCTTVRCRAHQLPGSQHGSGSEGVGRGQPEYQPRSRTQAHTTAIMSEPLSVLDVDAELWQVLDLCSDDELEAVYSVLHAPSPFSPVVKSLVTEREPPLVEQRGRLSLMHKIEARFRFLAADQADLLRGSRPTYRDTLLAVRDRMDVPCSTNLSTFDLETEVFLHLLHNCVEYVQGDEEVGNPTEAAARVTAQEEGDGMSSTRSSNGGSNWVERVTAPIMFGIKELIPTVAKLGSAITVTEVGRRTASQLATQLLQSHIKYQAAARAAAAAAATRAGAAAGLSSWGRQAMLEGAAKGLQAATARYSALQGALSFIGPVMWGWLAVDLAFKAIGTDYARVIRAVFILAQVRLLRTNGFTNPPKVGSSDAAAAAAAAASSGPVVVAEGFAALAAPAADQGEQAGTPSEGGGGTPDGHMGPNNLLHPPYRQEGCGGQQGTAGPTPPGSGRAGKGGGVGGAAGGGRHSTENDEDDDDPYTHYDNIYN